MKECTHTVCRSARSDELLRQAVRLWREGKHAQSDAMALSARDIHLAPVDCRMPNDEEERRAAASAVPVAVQQNEM